MRKISLKIGLIILFIATGLAASYLFDLKPVHLAKQLLTPGYSEKVILEEFAARFKELINKGDVEKIASELTATENVPSEAVAIFKSQIASYIRTGRVKSIRFEKIGANENFDNIKESGLTMSGKPSHKFWFNLVNENAEQKKVVGLVGGLVAESFRISLVHR